MKSKKARIPLGQRMWFKILPTLLIFIPPITQFPYDTAITSNVIAEVMAHPLVSSIPALLPIAKLLLLLAALIPFLGIKYANKLLIGYYASILLVVGAFQNMACTGSYGFVWLIGNTLVQLVVAAYCMFDLVKRSQSQKPRILTRAGCGFCYRCLWRL